MIKSMTGYGKATTTAGRKTLTVEVRSLNSKQMDLGVRMPAAMRSFETELRGRATMRLVRGKADIQVNVEEQAAAGVAKINAGIFAEYCRQIVAAATEAGIEVEAVERLIPSILRLPEVMNTEAANEVTDEETAALYGALDAALDALDEFRTQEGAVLSADMLARVATIEGLMGKLEPLEAARVPAIRARIMDNIAAVGVTVDANRLEQEMIFWVEKLDVTEEKVRLKKHCDYFRQTVREAGAGRKLGFIAQEMGREINTLGSKANDAEIQKIVVQMKDELEKIKEQLLNIL